jgi:hypothetical protein
VAFQPEQLEDSDQLVRWAYDPGFEKNIPTKGLIFKSAPPHLDCESHNWRKYMNGDDSIHSGGTAKTKDKQSYLGYYNAKVGDARNVHKGKSYETQVWFEVSHTPKDDNQAHSDIKLIKGSAPKPVLKQAKIDLAREVLSDLVSYTPPPPIIAASTDTTDR